MSDLRPDCRPAVTRPPRRARRPFASRGDHHSAPSQRAARPSGRSPLRPAVAVALSLAAALALSGCASMPPAVREYRAHLSYEPVLGQTMAYADAGPHDGQVIVLTHGLPTSSYLYRNVIPGLAAKGFRVIAPDFVGFGASSKPEDEAAYALPLQADRLLALLDQLGVARFSLVVHDLGGLISFELLDRAPQRVERLMVLDTTAYTEGFEPPREMRMLGGWMGGMMAASMRGALLGPWLTASFVRDNVGRPERVDQAAADLYWWSLHEGAVVPMRAVAGHFDAYLAQFPRYQQALRRFTGPAALLWGEGDRVLPFEKLGPQFARDLRIPPERVRAVKGAKHFLQEDAPEAVTEAILELMREPAVAAR